MLLCLPYQPKMENRSYAAIRCQMCGHSVKAHDGFVFGECMVTGCSCTTLAVNESEYAIATFNYA